MEYRGCDVAIVGVGLAGLTAAAEIERAGASVVVLEARPEVGGRVRSRSLGGPSGGAAADLGGQFVGLRHREMHRLIASLGLRLVPARLGTRPTLWRLGGRVGSDSCLPCPRASLRPWAVPCSP